MSDNQLSPECRTRINDPLERFYAPVNYNGRNRKSDDGAHEWKNFGADLGVGFTGLLTWLIFDGLLKGKMATRYHLNRPVPSAVGDQEIADLLAVYRRSNHFGIGSAGGTTFTITYDGAQAARSVQLGNLDSVEAMAKRGQDLQRLLAGSEAISLKVASAGEALVASQGVRAEVAHGKDALSVIDGLLGRAKPEWKTVAFNTREMGGAQFEAFLRSLRDNKITVSEVTSVGFGWKFAAGAIGVGIAVYLAVDFINDIRMGFNHDTESRLS